MIHKKVLIIKTENSLNVKRRNNILRIINNIVAVRTSLEPLYIQRNGINI